MANGGFAAKTAVPTFYEVLFRFCILAWFAETLCPST